MTSGLGAYGAVQSSSNRKELKKIKCVAVERDYNKLTATTEQKQEYASCIDLNYPKISSPEEVLVLKAFIVLALIGGTMGFCYSFKDRDYNNWGDHILFTIVGTAGAPALAMFAILVIVAVHFLFS